MLQLRGLLGTNFSLEGHLAILGTIVDTYVPRETSPYIGDIQGQT
jgi:hypothetical protein